MGSFGVGVDLFGSCDGSRGNRKRCLGGFGPGFALASRRGALCWRCRRLLSFALLLLFRRRRRRHRLLLLNGGRLGDTDTLDIVIVVVLY